MDTANGDAQRKRWPQLIGKVRLTILKLSGKAHDYAKPLTLIC